MKLTLVFATTAIVCSSLIISNANAAEESKSLPPVSALDINSTIQDVIDEPSSEFRRTALHR